MLVIAGGCFVDLRLFLSGKFMFCDKNNRLGIDRSALLDKDVGEE